MKKRFVSGLIALAASTLLVSPAGAAVPSKQAKQTLACRPGEGDAVARLWFTRSKGKLTKLAVDNPCGANVVIYESGSGYASGAPSDRLIVSPGAHFNWGKKRIAQYDMSTLAPTLLAFKSSECGGPTSVRVIERYDVVRPAMEDGGGC